MRGPGRLLLLLGYGLAVLTASVVLTLAHAPVPIVLALIALLSRVRVLHEGTAEQDGCVMFHLCPARRALLPAQVSHNDEEPGSDAKKHAVGGDMEA
jgi:hypothetical protein